MIEVKVTAENREELQRLLRRTHFDRAMVLHEGARLVFHAEHMPSFYAALRRIQRKKQCPIAVPALPPAVSVAAVSGV